LEYQMMSLLSYHEMQRSTFVHATFRVFILLPTLHIHMNARHHSDLVVVDHARLAL
jgi:hypothetical protein